MPAAAPTSDTAPSWELLRQFWVVARCGSLSKAAESLGVSQPTLSRQMDAMEAQLGHPVFERSTRGMRLTALGQRLMEPIAQMHAASMSAQRLVQANDASLDGEVVVSASEMTSTYVLPPIVAALARAHAGLRVKLVSTDAVSDLVEREADIAVRMVQPREPSLVARKVGEMRVVAVASHDYLAAHGEPSGFADMPGHHIVECLRETGLRPALQVAGVDLSALRFTASTNSHVVAWKMVRAGLGIGFVTEAVAVMEPAVRRILPDAPTPVLPVWLAVHQEIKSSPRIRTVYDHLAQALAERCVASGGKQR
jgi:DNA-binding transcriptional LysR family regulator